jgi:two-component system C4-dicarboxylate transport response regulator DctD
MTDVRIALVDDDPDLRTALVQTMTLAGFAVDAFSGAQEALGAIDRTYPGVVVTDIRMPVMDGIALFQRLRDRDPDLPVIFMTGHGEVTMAVDAMKAGAWDFLTKPLPRNAGRGRPPRRRNATAGIGKPPPAPIGRRQRRSGPRR